MHLRKRRGMLRQQYILSFWHHRTPWCFDSFLIVKLFWSRVVSMSPENTRRRNTIPPRFSLPSTILEMYLRNKLHDETRIREYFMVVRSLHWLVLEVKRIQDLLNKNHFSGKKKFSNFISNSFFFGLMNDRRRRRESPSHSRAIDRGWASTKLMAKDSFLFDKTYYHNTITYRSSSQT